MKADATIAAITTGGSDFRISQTASGNTVAPTIEPIEIWRVQATVTTKTGSTAATAPGVRHRKAPTKLATAFPPWNLRNTGYACPAITAKAAALIQNGLWSVVRPASQTAK